MFRFLHAADIHLDSPLRGLDRYEGAPVDECRGATRRALENLVDGSGERVAFVAIVGDLYDGDWPDYNTGLFFGKQMVRLRDGGIPVFMIRGNHDAANKMTKDLKLVDNVHVLSSQQAETLVLEDQGVAIHGQSFPTQAVLTNLARSYPARRKGYFNLGLLHTCVDGREGHEPYAPCSLADPARGNTATGRWVMFILARSCIGMIPGLSFRETCRGGSAGARSQGLHAGDRR